MSEDEAMVPRRIAFLPPRIGTAIAEIDDDESMAEKLYQIANEYGRWLADTGEEEEEPIKAAAEIALKFLQICAIAEGDGDKIPMADIPLSNLVAQVIDDDVVAHFTNVASAYIDTEKR